VSQLFHVPAIVTAVFVIIWIFNCFGAPWLEVAAGASTNPDAIAPPLDRNPDHSKYLLAEHDDDAIHIFYIPGTPPSA
jgi:hypothetical protein